MDLTHFVLLQLRQEVLDEDAELLAYNIQPTKESQACLAYFGSGARKRTKTRCA